MDHGILSIQVLVYHMLLQMILSGFNLTINRVDVIQAAVT